MAYPRALGDALVGSDIDPRLWAASYEGRGTFADFLLASAVAVSLGFPAYGPGGARPMGAGGWTKNDYQESISQAVEVWPAPSEGEDHEHPRDAQAA